MRLTNVALITCLAILTAPTTGWSKGRITKIVIEGDGLSAPIEITSPEIVDQFSIWSGPGVVTRGPDGVQQWSKYSDPRILARWFIDWNMGLATERPSRLQRLEVTFHIGVPTEPNTTRRFVFAYEIGASNHSGYIYLPRWKNDLISYRVGGNWLHATARWNEIMMPIVAKHSTDSTVSLKRGSLNCKIGNGSLNVNGTIEFRLVNEYGAKTSRWRYETSMEKYRSVKEHIGDVEPGEEIEISCWPPRS